MNCESIYVLSTKGHSQTGVLKRADMLKFSGNSLGVKSREGL